MIVNEGVLVPCIYIVIPFSIIISDFYYTCVRLAAKNLINFISAYFNTIRRNKPKLTECNWKYFSCT